MPYVQRDAQVKICGAYANPQPGYAEEPVSDTDPALLAFLAPKPPIDLSNVDNLEKTLKAMALVMRDYCNQLKAGTYVGTGVGGTKTIAEVKADFATKYNSLP